MLVMVIYIYTIGLRKKTNECRNIIILYTLPLCTESRMDNGDMKDNGTCSTTNDMTANPAYGTTSRIMAHNTTANPWICENDELIMMHKNPTYATSDETTPTTYV